MLQARLPGQQLLVDADCMGNSSSGENYRDGLVQTPLQQLLGVEVAPLTAGATSGGMPGAAEAAAQQLYMAAQRALEANLSEAVGMSAEAAPVQLKEAAAGLYALGDAAETCSGAEAAGPGEVAQLWGHSAVSGAPQAMQPLLLEVALAASEQLQARAAERLQQQLAALVAEQQQQGTQHTRLCDAAQRLQRQAAMEVGSGMSVVMEQLPPHLMQLWVSADP
jgi:hypothetical protein